MTNTEQLPKGIAPIMFFFQVVTFAATVFATYYAWTHTHHSLLWAAVTFFIGGSVLAGLVGVIVMSILAVLTRKKV